MISAPRKSALLPQPGTGIGLGGPKAPGQPSLSGPGRPYVGAPKPPVVPPRTVPAPTQPPGLGVRPLTPAGPKPMAKPGAQPAPKAAAVRALPASELMNTAGQKGPVAVKGIVNSLGKR